jgi:hypothetical protein
MYLYKLIYTHTHIHTYSDGGEASGAGGGIAGAGGGKASRLSEAKPPNSIGRGHES